MIQLKKITLIAVIALAFWVLSGCKKSTVQASLVLSGIYQQTTTENLSAVYMYTMNGRITNQDTINAYVSRHAAAIGTIILFKSTVQYGASTEVTQANFLANGNVTWGQTNSTLYSTFAITQKTSTGFILKDADSSIYTYDTSRSHSDVLISNSGYLTEISNCREFFYNSGYEGVCFYRPEYPFVIKDGQIYMCLYSCFINSYPYSYSGIGNYAGTFDTGVLKALTKGDTLLYQNATVLFNKKD